jgi:hypothetical protein
VLFEIYKHEQKQTAAAVRIGFSLFGFLFTWIWALANRLWLQGILLFLADVAITLGAFLFGPKDLPSALHLQQFFLTLYIPIRLFVGLKGNEWKSRALAERGYAYKGDVSARSRDQALRQARSEGFSKLGSAARPSRHVGKIPVIGFRPVATIAWLTWKAAFRFRLFLVLAALLLLAVIGLPALIKDDGTARGFTQILLTYTLGAITALLGLSTLWLACGTLARDIEECQIQVVAVKPIARWQIWLGKWLGIVSLNAALLALSGASVYTLLLWRSTRLPADQQQILRNEVLVARGSAREKSFDSEIDAETDRRLRERLQKNPVGKADLLDVHKQIREKVKSEYQVVPPGTYRQWDIDLGLAKNALRDQPLYLRVKFNAADKGPSGTFQALWQYGVPRKTEVWRSKPMSLAPDTFHEFEIPPNLFDQNGVLTVIFVNPNNTSLLFPLEDGLEVLYREGGFALNFARGLGIICCWMALLAALGLASASFLSFPVAAFFALGLLTMTFSTGILANVVSEGTIMDYNAESGQKGHTFLDSLAVPTFRAALQVIDMAKGYSPIDSLSTGRSITWSQLGQAFSQVVLLLGGIIGLGGIFVFSRRELATAQGTQ